MTYPDLLTGLTEGGSPAGAQITANTTTIQTAIDNKNGPVMFPPGLYKHNPLTIRSGTSLIGAGNTTEGGNAVEGAFTHLNLVRIGTATTPMLSIGTGVCDVTIRDIVLDGGLFANNPSCDVVNVADNTNPDQVNLRMERVTVTQSGNYGLYVGTKRDDVKIYDCAFLYSQKSGLLTKGPDGVYDSCAFGDNGRDGSSANVQLQAVVNRVTNCDIWGASGHAPYGIYVVASTTGCVITGNGIDRHDKQGVYVDTGCYSISIFNNVFHYNSVSANNTYAHCYVKADLAGAASVDGNVAIYDGAQGTNAASYLIQGGTIANVLLGSLNYAQVGGTTPGVNTAIHN
jgi:hypothetical protein